MHSTETIYSQSVTNEIVIGWLETDRTNVMQCYVLVTNQIKIENTEDRLFPGYLLDSDNPQQNYNTFLA